jgi:hypothetical protein
MIARYGKGSAEETSITGHLKIILKGEKHEEIIEYERQILDDFIAVLDLGVSVISRLFANWQVLVKSEKSCSRLRNIMSPCGAGERTLPSDSHS